VNAVVRQVRPTYPIHGLPPAPERAAVNEGQLKTQEVPPVTEEK